MGTPGSRKQVPAGAALIPAAMGTPRARGPALGLEAPHHLFYADASAQQMLAAALEGGTTRTPISQTGTLRRKQLSFHTAQSSLVRSQDLRRDPRPVPVVTTSRSPRASPPEAQML